MFVPGNTVWLLTIKDVWRRPMWFSFLLGRSVGGRGEAYSGILLEPLSPLPCDEVPPPNPSLLTAGHGTHRVPRDRVHFPTVGMEAPVETL